MSRKGRRSAVAGPQPARPTTRDPRPYALTTYDLAFRLLGGDDNDARAATATVDRGLGGILQHVDARDVVWTEPAQSRARRERDTVNHDERFTIAEEAADAANAQ